MRPANLPDDENRDCRDGDYSRRRWTDPSGVDQSDREQRGEEGQREDEMSRFGRRRRVQPCEHECERGHRNHACCK